jgi:hypothetical protein
MDFKAKTVGARALLLISKDEIGKAVSIFSNTVNIRTLDDELIVLTAKGLRSPIHINIVGQALDRCVRALAKVVKEEGSIRVGNLKIELEGFNVYENRFVEPSFSGLKRLKGGENYIILLLHLLEREGSVLSRNFMGRKELYDFYSSLIKGGRELDAMLGLLGLGPGYTPSGDDFLAGYLAGRNHLSAITGSGKLTIPYEVMAKRTSWVSSKLLYYAQNLIVDEDLEKALNSISLGRREGLVDSIIALARRGHTSGLDIALGLITALFSCMDEIYGGEALKLLFSSIFR